MLNFVYCLDENYNKQCLNSIYSILNYSDIECSFYVIHKDPSTLKPLNKKILEHENLKNIVINEFKDTKADFVNLEKVHVTDPTYYRLFISNYVPEEVRKIIYVDPDVICLKQFNNEIFKNISIMENQNLDLAAVTEDHNEVDKDNAKRLNLTNGKYFNAGFLIINLLNWRKLNIVNEFKNLLKTNKERLELHDQDILNIFYDGNYLELDNGMNFTVPGGGEKYLEKIKKYKFENITFIHYTGNKKPWHIKGILHEAGEPYREAYERLYKKKYHLADSSKKNSFKLFIKMIFDKRFKELKHPYYFIFYFFQNLIKTK